MGSGWHSGMRSWVLFAAMMPAIRAAPSTSPFLASPESTRSSVGPCMITRPSAMATRSVGGLPETSTMRASPARAIWVSLRGLAMFKRALGGRDPPSGVALKGRAGRWGDVVLPHQALADQEGGDAHAGEPLEVGRREDAALADDDPLGRD